MTGAADTWQSFRSPDTSQPFQRLVPFSWSGELLVICGGMLLPFLVAGFWYPYWRIADMDFWVVYNAFLLNTPLPQEYFDHPGYLSILLLAEWLRALHGLGIVKVISLPAIPPVSDMVQFASAWMQATQAGRVLSLIVAMSFVVSFAFLLRALVRDWRIAAVGAFLLAFSGGMAMQIRIMRTELLDDALFYSALLMLMISARRRSHRWRPAIVGIASMLIALTLLNKVQFFFLICALPLLLIPFGPDDAPRAGFWQGGAPAWLALALSIAAALVSTYLAKNIVIEGFGAGGSFVPMTAGANVYWPLVTAWLALGMIAYALMWRVPPLEMFTAMFAALAGGMIGLLALYIRYNPNNVAVVFHPIEQMLVWASASQPQLAHGDTAGRVRFLLEAIGGVIARRTFVLQSSSRPAIFLEWFVVAATIIAIKRREWRLVLQVAALMLTDWAIDTLGMGRGLKQEYFIITDPLAIIAAALLIAKLTDLQRHRWTYPIGAALIVAHIVVSQAEPVKHVFKSEGPEVWCGLYGYAPRVERYPFCPPDPKPSR